MNEIINNILEQSLWADVIIIGCVLFLALKGIINGFVREVFSFLGLIGGIYLASKFASSAAEFINSIYEIDDSIASLIGFLAVLFVVWLFCHILGNVFSSLAQLSNFNILNRIGGYIFSATKIFLIFSVFYYCLMQINLINNTIKDYANKSYVLPYLQQAGAILMQNELINTPNNIPAKKEEIKEEKI